MKTDNIVAFTQASKTHKEMVSSFTQALLTLSIRASGANHETNAGNLLFAALLKFKKITGQLDHITDIKKENLLTDDENRQWDKASNERGWNSATNKDENIALAYDIALLGKKLNEDGFDNLYINKTLLEACLCLCPSSPQYHYMMGYLLKETAIDFEKAKHHFSKVLTLCDESSPAKENIKEQAAQGLQSIHRQTTARHLTPIK